MMKRLAILAAPALVAGCVSFGAKVPDQLFNLTPTQAVEPGRTVSGTLGEGILVIDPETDRRIDVNRVPVQVDASNVAYLKNAMWVERPARQFRHLLAETLRARSGSFVREGGELDSAASRTLAGRLLEMGYDARAGGVVVVYDAMLSGKGDTMTVCRFEARVPGVPAKAEAVGPALNQAANQVAAQVSDWVLGS